MVSLTLSLPAKITRPSQPCCPARARIFSINSAGWSLLPGSCCDSITPTSTWDRSGAGPMKTSTWSAERTRSGPGAFPVGVKSSVVPQPRHVRTLIRAKQRMAALYHCPRDSTTTYSALLESLAPTVGV
jgi:hypothetical protein